MAGKMINKMMGFLGLEDDLEEDEDLEEIEDDRERKNTNNFETVEPIVNSKRQNKVESMHNTIYA